MKLLSHRMVLYISLLLLVFSASMSRADESRQESVLQTHVSRPLTVDEFRAALPEKAEELDMDGFLKLKEAKEVVVLDVRSKEKYERRRLKGSLNAPLTDLTEKNLPQLAPDKETPVVLVCDYSFQPVRMIAMTLQAYPVLKANGYKNIHRLNLWHDRNGGGMRDEKAQEKLLEFEGTDVK